jgi:hypothetical protein
MHLLSMYYFWNQSNKKILYCLTKNVVGSFCSTFNHFHMRVGTTVPDTAGV